MEVLSEKERIGEYAKELKITVIKDELDDFITLGTEQNWSYRTLLCQLLSASEDNSFIRLGLGAFSKWGSTFSISYLYKRMSTRKRRINFGPNFFG